VLSQTKHAAVYAANNEIYDALEPGDTVPEHPFAPAYSHYGNVYDGAIQYWTGGSPPAFGIHHPLPAPQGFGLLEHQQGQLLGYVERARGQPAVHLDVDHGQWTDNQHTQLLQGHAATLPAAPPPGHGTCRRPVTCSGLHASSTRYGQRLRTAHRGEGPVTPTT
jgi:hypothetical protein